MPVTLRDSPISEPTRPAFRLRLEERRVPRSVTLGTSELRIPIRLLGFMNPTTSDHKREQFQMVAATISSVASPVAAPLSNANIREQLVIRRR